MNRDNNFTLSKKPSQQQPLSPHTSLSIVIEKPAVRTPLREAVKKDFWPPKINSTDSKTKK